MILRKNLIRFIAGLIGSFCVGLLIWASREFVVMFDTWMETGVSNYLLNYDHTLYFIVFFGLPFGTCTAVFLVDRQFFKVQKRVLDMTAGFLISILGIILVVWLLPAAGIDVARLCPLFHLMGYDVYTVLLPLTVSLFFLIGIGLMESFRKTK